MSNETVTMQGNSAGLSINPGESKCVHRQELSLQAGKGVILDKLKSSLSCSRLGLTVQVLEHDYKSDTWIQAGDEYNSNNIQTYMPFVFDKVGRDMKIVILISIKSRTYQPIETAGDSWKLDFHIQ